jgi:hypothetical protein
MSNKSTRNNPTATIGLLTAPNVNNIPIIASVAQLMRIPVTFSNLKTQALIDTGAAASFLAHRLLVRIPYKDIKELEVSDPNVQLFRTVSGELVKPIGRYELSIRLARRHPFIHQFYVITDLDEGCILG